MFKFSVFFSAARQAGALDATIRADALNGRLNVHLAALLAADPKSKDDPGFGLKTLRKDGKPINKPEVLKLADSYRTCKGADYITGHVRRAQVGAMLDAVSALLRIGAKAADGDALESAALVALQDAGQYLGDLAAWETACAPVAKTAEEQATAAAKRATKAAKKAAEAAAAAGLPAPVVAAPVTLPHGASDADISEALILANKTGAPGVEVAGFDPLTDEAPSVAAIVGEAPQAAALVPMESQSIELTAADLFEAVMAAIVSGEFSAEQLGDIRGACSAALGLDAVPAAMLAQVATQQAAHAH